MMMKEDSSLSFLKGDLSYKAVLCGISVGITIKGRRIGWSRGMPIIIIIIQ